MAVIETSSRELNVNRVAGGIITAVELLSFKFGEWKMELTNVDLRDAGF